MKSGTRLLLLLGMLCLAAASGYFLVKPWSTGLARGPADADSSGLQWLQKEYALTDTQFERIKQEHDTYHPRCMEMCEEIRLANARVAELLGRSTAMTPEVETALKEAEATYARCRATMLAHVYRVAALMPPEAGRRYIQDVAPRLLTGAHSVDEVMMSHSPGSPP